MILKFQRIVYVTATNCCATNSNSEEIEIGIIFWWEEEWIQQNSQRSGWKEILSAATAHSITVIYESIPNAFNISGNKLIDNDTKTVIEKYSDAFTRLQKNQSCLLTVFSKVITKMKRTTKINNLHYLYRNYFTSNKRRNKWW